MSFWNTVKNTFRINKPGYAGFACTTSFPQIVTIGPVVLTVWLPPAVDAKDLDPDLEHEKSVPTVEALLALNLKDSAVIVAVIIIVNYILALYENCTKILIFKIIYKTPLNV